MSNPTKRPKLDEAAAMAATDSANAYGTILELALPFLSVDDLFDNIFSVSTGIHQKCVNLLNSHCQAHHPMLVFMEQTHTKRNQINNNDDNDNDNGANNKRHQWLTYKRYRCYQEENEPTDQRDYSRLAEYELILEISTYSNKADEEKPLLLVHDVQPLCVEREFDVGCTFRIDNFPCPNNNKDMRKGIVRELQYRVRVVMRKKSNGKICIIMNTTDDQCTHCSPQTDYYHSFIYQSGELLPESFGHANFYADLQFTLFRTSSGEVSFEPDEDDDDDDDDEPVKIEFQFYGGYPEYVLQAIDSWRWL